MADEYFDYQADLGLVQTLADCCVHSWKARERESTDKGAHKLPTIVAGSGGGKSRLLKELGDVLKAADWSSAPELGKRMENVLVFHVTFENGTGGQLDPPGTPFPDSATGASQRVGLRIAHQLLPDKSIKSLIRAATRGDIPGDDLDPENLFRRLATAEACDVADLTIILCVDAVHEAGGKPYGAQIGDRSSPMRRVVSALSSLLRSSGKSANPFCFVCLSATSDEAFNPLPFTGTEKVTIVPPPVDPSRIFKGGPAESDGRLRTVIADMDGHPRALEYLFGVLVDQRDGHGGVSRSLEASVDDRRSITISNILQEWDPLSTVQEVVRRIKGKYDQSIRAGESLLEAVFLGLPIQPDASIRVGATDKFIQDIVGGGLIRYNTSTMLLSVPFVLLIAVLGAKPEYRDFFRDLYTYIDKSECEHVTGHSVCDAFEKQVALLWHLKTRLFEGKTMLWTELHPGAMFNPEWVRKNVRVTVKPAPLGVVKLKSKLGEKESLAVEQIMLSKQKTVTLMRRSGERDEFDKISYADLPKYLVVNGDQASAADVYAWVEEVSAGLRLFGTSCKVTPSTKRDIEKYLGELRKANGDADGFFMEVAYASSTIVAADLPERCGFVGKNEFATFFGPFASRLVLLVDSPSRGGAVTVAAAAASSAK